MPQQRCPSAIYSDYVLLTHRFYYAKWVLREQNKDVYMYVYSARWIAAADKSREFDGTARIYNTLMKQS